MATNPFNDPKKLAFIKAFAKCGIINQACKAAGIHRVTVLRWREEDAPFMVAFNIAKTEAVEMLEAEALRRAVEGVDKPVYQRGECVGVIREYSDALLQTLLRANAPEKYRERMDIKHIGLTAKVYQGVDVDAV